jgi:geranylgeranyl pyrophosphate synthase
VSAVAAEPLAQILELGGEPLSERLRGVEARLREIGAGSEHASATIEAGGKRLRPLLVCVAGLDGADGTALVRAAVTVELIHAATLVHDDVLDGAPLRRGRPTVFATAGRSAATATGDLLFSRAFAELALNGNVGQLQALSAATTALARGELIQREDAWRSDVGVERYLLRCELKTARLFEAACDLGAMATGAPRLGAFGRDVGLAFQILDDVLDVSGPAERTGKRRGTDLLDGTVTLPLIIARERDPSLRSLNLRAIGAPEPVCDQIVATGALAVARQRALDFVGRAKRRLPRTQLMPRQWRALELIADGVVERYS